MRFHFRIMKGHTTEELVQQEGISKNAYIGMAVVGLVLISMGAMKGP